MRYKLKLEISVDQPPIPRQMKTPIQNQLNMIATVLAVLEKTEFKAVREDQMPVVFTGKVRTLRGANAKALELAKRQTQPTTGTTDDKTGTEILLENLLLEEAGLLLSFDEDKGDAVNLAKDSLTAAAVRHLPNQELLSLGTTVADPAAALTEGSPAPGADYGISPESVAGLQAPAFPSGSISASPPEPGRRAGS